MIASSPRVTRFGRVLEVRLLHTPDTEILPKTSTSAVLLWTM
jgi:hypothetical protein